MPFRADSSVLKSDTRRFRRSLQGWFRRQGRDLPWRRTRDPYAILVSEFMLQQTQVATVIPYFESWRRRFPDFATLARAEESEVLHAWQGLGYYNRARSLRRAALYVLEEFGGRLPPDPAAINRLHGVGRYTAGAVASFAFDRSEPVVEANIARVLTRLTNWRKPIETGETKTHLWTTARALLPSGSSRLHNSALMDLGALVCLPRQPRCGECPVRTFCDAPEPALLPLRKRKPATIRLCEAHSFARKRDRILLERSQGRWRGMWILPRLPLAPRRRLLLQLNFPFTHHRVTLSVFSGSKAFHPNENLKWFALSELGNLPLPSPHRRALERLVPTIGKEQAT